MRLKTLLLGALALVLLCAPAFSETLHASPGKKFKALSGTQYTANAQGLILSVNPEDVVDLLKSGAFHSSTASFSLPVASINSGAILFSSVTDRAFCVDGAILYSSGNAATCTGISLRDAANNDAILTFSASGLRNGSAVSFASGGSYITLGTDYVNCTDAGHAVKIEKNGSNCVGLTDVILRVNYSTK